MNAERVQRMGRWLACGMLALWLAGCATTSTVESRRQERLGAYQSLPVEQRMAVDSGRIKVGMSRDAVYIALGRPHQILAGESSKGAMETWLYYGSAMREVQYWGYHHHYYYGHGRRYFGGPTIVHDYYPQRYVQTEVVFEGDAVKEWRSLPAPPN